MKKSSSRSAHTKHTHIHVCFKTRTVVRVTTDDAGGCFGVTTVHAGLDDLLATTVEGVPTGERGRTAPCPTALVATRGAAVDAAAVDTRRAVTAHHASVCCRPAQTGILLCLFKEKTKNVGVGATHSNQPWKRLRFGSQGKPQQRSFQVSPPKTKKKTLSRASYVRFV